jgi:hypothetical protein
MELKNMEDKKIFVILVLGLMFLTSLPMVPNARAETEDVTVKWYIPSDISIDIAYPTGLTGIEFRPLSMTFSDQDAYLTVGGTPSVRVTNSGNVAINLKLNLTGDLPTGVIYYNISTRIVYATSLMKLYWGTANETTQLTTNGSIAISGTRDLYASACGEDVANTTYPINKKMRIISIAA